MTHCLYWWNSTESIWERLWFTFQNYDDAQWWAKRYETVYKIRVCVWGADAPRPKEPPEPREPCAFKPT